MKKKILEKLQSTDGFVSGQELCELLGVSRTAVWKNIQALKNDGYVIEGVNNKGYRLVSVPDVMSEENISRYLNTKTFARLIQQTPALRLLVRRILYTAHCLLQMSRRQEKAGGDIAGIQIREQRYPCRIC